MEFHTPTLFYINQLINPLYGGSFYPILIENPLGEQIFNEPITDVIGWCKWASGLTDEYFINKLDCGGLLSVLPSVLLWGGVDLKGFPGGRILLRLIAGISRRTSRERSLQKKAIILITENTSSFQSLGELLPEELDTPYANEKLRAADKELKAIDDALFQLASEVSTPNPQKINFIAFVRCGFALARLAVRAKIDGQVTHAVLRECWQLGLYLELDYEARKRNLAILDYYFRNSNDRSSERSQFRFQSTKPPSLMYLGRVRLQKITKKIIKDMVSTKITEEETQLKIDDNIQRHAKFYRVSSNILNVYRFLILSIKEKQKFKSAKADPYSHGYICNGLPCIQFLNKNISPKDKKHKSNYFDLAATFSRNNDHVKKELEIARNAIILPIDVDFRVSMISKFSAFLLAFLLALSAIYYYVKKYEYDVAESAFSEPLWWLATVIALLFCHSICQFIPKYFKRSLIRSSVLLFSIIGVLVVFFKVQPLSM